MQVMNEIELFTGSFEDFSLPVGLANGLKDLGYTKPTFVQRQVFEPARNGLDVVVQSHTGSGKTTAFCLPVLCRIDLTKLCPQTLILVPTRELARQVAVECGRLAHHYDAKVAAIYGGASFDAQIAALKAGAQIIIGTPGRVKDLIERRHLDVSGIKMAILDEADEMLSMGFWDDVTYLLGLIPKGRQTLLFSATLPPAIESALSQLTTDPTRLNLSSDQQATKTVRHVIHIEDESQPKSRNLLYALELHHPKHAIVFCNTRDETDLLERYLRRFAFNARALHGEMSQNAREKVMAAVKNGELDIVIATDIAARGIDIGGLTHVFNYELPESDEVYVHRTGRTGRIGSSGTAVSLVRGQDMNQLPNFKSKFDIDIEDIKLPPTEELLWMQAERMALYLTEACDGVEVSQYRPVAESMIKRGDASEILAFLLRAYFSSQVPVPPIHVEKEVHVKKAPKEKPKSIFVETAPVVEKTVHKPVIILAKDRPKEELLAEEETSDIEEAVIDDEPRSDYARLYITMGRHDGFADLTALAHYLSITTGVDLGHFTGMGHVRDTSSHIEVDAEASEAIITTMNGRFKSPENPILCEIAKGIDPPSQKYKPRRPVQK